MNPINIEGTTKVIKFESNIMYGEQYIIPISTRLGVMTLSLSSDQLLTLLSQNGMSKMDIRNLTDSKMVIAIMPKG